MGEGPGSSGGLGSWRGQRAAPRALSGYRCSRAGTQAQPGSGYRGCAGGSGAPTRSGGLDTWGRAAPGCGRKSFPNCGKRQGLKPHGNSPFARRRTEEGESLKAEVPPPPPRVSSTHWVDLISLLPLWASISPFVGAGFGSALELVAGPKAVGRALDLQFSPHLFTSSRPGTLGGAQTRTSGGAAETSDSAAPSDSDHILDLVGPSESRAIYTQEARSTVIMGISAGWQPSP